MFNSICLMLSLFKGYPKEEIQRVIKATNLEGFIEALPDGLDTYIGEGGKSCSGGEKQKIALARALLLKSNFLILDESTANVDNINADKIMENILSLKDCGNIIITHQLNYKVLSKCRKIYVMKQGKVVEEGNLNQLLDKKGYLYSLYSV